jgi:hypothetical protein
MNPIRQTCVSAAATHPNGIQSAAGNSDTATECAGYGPNDQPKNPRPYSLRHRNTPKVFPVTDVFSCGEICRGPPRSIPEPGKTPRLRYRDAEFFFNSPFEFRFKPQFSRIHFRISPVFDEIRPSGDNRRVASR